MQTIESLIELFDGVRARGNGFMACCPAHDDRSPSLSISEGDDGRVLLRCFAGCPTEAVLEAIGLTWADLFPDDGGPTEGGARRAVPRAERRVWAVGRRFVKPVPDQKRLVPFVEKAYRLLSESPDLQSFLKQKRNISWTAAQRFGLGACDVERDSRGAITRCAWVMPISEHGEPALAVKLHHENPKPGKPKTFWMPMGTDPSAKPRHGWATLWPPPESWPCMEWQERAAVLEYMGRLPRAEAEKAAKQEIGWMHVTEGELKALRLASLGKAATSPTTGANTKWSSEMVERLRGWRVMLWCDHDEAGWRFRDETLEALLCEGIECRVA